MRNVINRIGNTIVALVIAFVLVASPVVATLGLIQAQAWTGFRTVIAIICAIITFLEFLFIFGTIKVYADGDLW